MKDISPDNLFVAHLFFGINASHQVIAAATRQEAITSLHDYFDAPQINYIFSIAELYDLQKNHALQHGIEMENNNNRGNRRGVENQEVIEDVDYPVQSSVQDNIQHNIQQRNHKNRENEKGLNKNPKQTDKYFLEIKIESSSNQHILHKAVAYNAISNINIEDNKIEKSIDNSNNFMITKEIIDNALENALALLSRSPILISNSFSL